MFGWNHTSLLYISESIGGQERVASNLCNLLIGQVTGVALLGNTGYQAHGSLFIKREYILVCLQPLDQWIRSISWRWGKGHLFLERLRDLDPAESTHLQQPIPEFRDPRDRMVVTICVNKDIGVEKVKHGHRLS
jgi:hypothetical protein